MEYDYTNDLAQFKIEDDFLRIVFATDLKISIDVAKALVLDRLRFQSYSDFKVLCDVSQIHSIDIEARTYLSTYGSSLLKKVALVACTPPLYQMARFYIRTNTPKVPTAVFRTTEEAELYLKL